MSTTLSWGVAYLIAAGIQALQLDAGSAHLVVHAADGSASELQAIELATTRPLVQITQAATPA